MLKSDAVIVVAPVSFLFFSFFFCNHHKEVAAGGV